MSVKRKYMFDISVDVGGGFLKAARCHTNWDRDDGLEEVEKIKKEIIKEYKVDPSMIHVHETFFTFRENRPDLKGIVE